MKVNICLAVLALCLFGCQPYLTYDELAELAPTSPEALKKLERFEIDLERADQFILSLEKCWRGCVVVCVDSHFSGGNSIYRRKFRDTTDKVRWYRQARTSCGARNFSIFVAR